MPSGFESYVTQMDSDPKTALASARSHLVWLMQQQGPRVGDAGTTYDPASLDTAIATTRTDINSLTSRTSLVGIPSLIPVRRALYG